LLDLPAGFSYRIVSTAGEPMDDGFVTPSNLDGMGCFPLDRRRVILVRNHELSFRTRDRGPTGADPAHRTDRLVDVVADEASDTVLDELGHGVARVGDHGRAACHGFDHDHAERLGPPDRKQQRACAAEERLLLGFVDLADQLDPAGTARRDFALVVVAIGGAELCGDAQGPCRR
jgi:hypothetical protein